MKVRLYWFILVMILSCNYLFGQSFEIPIYFEDATSNRDTIILGYNVLAGYGIDQMFGEINIIDSSYSDNLEVRAAIYEYDANNSEYFRIMESKKMIIGYVCYDPFYSKEGNAIMVIIKSDHWPVTISWNKDNFMETCNYLEIIDCTPGGWFDVCGPGHPYLSLDMHLTDTATYYDTDYKVYVEEDTLGALFFPFYDGLISNLSVVSDFKSVEGYPNPTTGSFHIDYPLTTYDRISITDLSGNAVAFTYSHQEIILGDIPDGIYIMSTVLYSGGTFALKIIKRS